MKPLSVLILAGILLFCLGCEPPGDFTVESSFKDATTFVIVAKGKPKAGVADELQRRYTAERAALLVAKNEMVDKLKNYRILDETVGETRYDGNQNCFLTCIVTVRKK